MVTESRLIIVISCALIGVHEDLDGRSRLIVWVRLSEAGILCKVVGYKDYCCRIVYPCGLRWHLCHFRLKDKSK